MMKKIILLGLLSVSMCLSQAAEVKAAPNLTAAPVVTNVTAAPVVTNVTAVEPKEKNISTSIPPHVETEIPKNETETKQTVTEGTPLITKPSETTPPHKEESPKPVDNKTAEKEPKAKEIPKELPKNATETKATTEKPMNDMTAKNSTTMKPEMPSSTHAPKSEDKHVLQARGFDGPSFIGGMILTLGLLAIGFMGFKYYKNQTERNYHTL